MFLLSIPPLPPPLAIVEEITQTSPRIREIGITRVQTKGEGLMARVEAITKIQTIIRDNSMSKTRLANSTDSRDRAV
jgi:hypothetical protein